MKIERMASFPLILQDPFISIWSPCDTLNGGDTTHWSGVKQRLFGYLLLNEKPYSFLGEKGICPGMTQTGVELTATTTTYYFEAEGVTLKVAFCSPLLLDDPDLVSRPCTYIDFTIGGAYEGKNPQVAFEVSADIVSAAYSTSHRTTDFLACCHKNSYFDVVGGAYVVPEYRYAYMNKSKQAPLSYSADNCTIDWGTCYVASAQEAAAITYSVDRTAILAKVDMEKAPEATLVFAYDDRLSIQYFEEARKGYWTRAYDSIFEAINASLKEHDDVMARCRELDQEIEAKAMELGGEDYAFICNAAYRHAIAAHKLIEDKNGDMIFLSRENDSNSCIGTVDVSYPSVPLFLLYDTEYVKGMMRPIFRFADCPVWEYDFAPHDVGRYPYATGQVYGLNIKDHRGEFDQSQGCTVPDLFLFPAGSNCFEHKYQMPVEECGNMLIMAAAVTKIDGNTEFVQDKMDTLKLWVGYLLENGMDPGEQLCTDDFAGHLAHNTNLSVKAILGVEAYAQINRALGKEDLYAEYHQKAVEMAENWEKTAATEAGDHTRLTFDNDNTWSLKYNVMWDLFFDSKLFKQDMIEKEIDYYLKKQNEFGTPLDSRADYTKSDWLLWCAAMTEDPEKRKAMIRPIAKFLRETSSRVAFSDWYDTVKGEYVYFIARSVQGGIFAPFLIRG